MFPSPNRALNTASDHMDVPEKVPHVKKILHFLAKGSDIFPSDHSFGKGWGDRELFAISGLHLVRLH